MEQTRYDDSLWPVSLVTVTSRPMDEAEFLLYLDTLSAFHLRGTAFVHVIDIRSAPALNAHQRRMFAERLDRDEKLYPGQLCGSGIVLSSAVQRGVFKAISWLLGNPRPARSFAEVDEAVRWAQSLLQIRADTGAQNHPTR